MKTNYTNRYGDNIIFEQTEPNKIEVSGYGDYYRVAYDNRYVDAYEAYVEDCNNLEDIDYDLLLDDPNLNVTRHMSLDEFKEAVHKEYFFNNPRLRKYCLMVKSDKNSLCMFDPSGGPYLEKGMNIGRYFDGKIGKQIIDNIEIKDNKVIFTTKSDEN